MHLKKYFCTNLDTQRYFLELAYDGTPYHGWQTQPNALTVQECLDKALSVCFRQPIETVGCGRTDAGVHARIFYAHFDLQNIAPDAALTSLSNINALLPYSIAVYRILPVAPAAHARFDAKQRGYEYHIHFKKDPFKLDRSWLLKEQPDVEAMNTACSILLKHTDFSCFSKSNTQTFTNNCKITHARFKATDNGLVFSIYADRFLRNMVRAIVGTLIRIGKHELAPSEMERIIESKDRSNAGQSVPACGLYLMHVEYPYITD